VIRSKLFSVLGPVQFPPAANDVARYRSLFMWRHGRRNSFRTSVSPNNYETWPISFLPINKRYTIHRLQKRTTTTTTTNNYSCNTNTGSKQVSMV